MPPRRPRHNLPQQQHGHQVYSALPNPQPGRERSGKTSPSKLHPGGVSADDLTDRILREQQQYHHHHHHQQGHLVTPATPASSPAPELEAALSGPAPLQTCPMTEADGQGATSTPTGGDAASPAPGVLSAPVSLHACDIHPLELASQPVEATIRPGRSAAEEAVSIATAITAAASGNGNGSDSRTGSGGNGAVEGGGDCAAVLSRPGVAQLGVTPPMINRLAVEPSSLPRAAPGKVSGDWRPPVATVEEGLVTHGSPIEGIAASSPARGSVARFAQATNVIDPPPYMASAEDVVRRSDTAKKDNIYGLSIVAAVRHLPDLVWALTARLLGSVWEVTRVRPLLAVAVAPAAVLLAADMVLELLLLPLLAIPGMLVSFTISFVVAAVVSLSYHRNRAAAERRHAAQALLYTAGTQLPAAVPATAAAAAGAPATTGAALPTRPVAIATLAATAASSTLTLVDDAGLAALRELFGGGALPAWLVDARHGERAEWANALLARIWPSVEGPLRDVAGPVIRAQADLAKPPFIRSVDLADLSLGSTPPRVEAVRLRPLASAAAQLEAAAAVRAVVVQTDTAAAAATSIAAKSEVAETQESMFSFDARPAAAAAAPSVAVASVSSAAAEAAAGAVPTKPATGVVLSGVSDAEVAAMAASVAVRQHIIGGGAAAPAASVPQEVKAVASGVEAIEVELDFQWRGEPTIGLFVEAYLSPGGGTVRLTPRLRELAAAGTVRLVLTPLVPYPPGFGAIQVSMPRAPQLAFAFDLGPTLGNVGGAAGPVASFLQPLIQDVVAEALVWPKRVVLPLLPEVVIGPLTELQLRTRGLLAVRLLAARGPSRRLEGADWEALKEGDQVEVVAFTRPDRRAITPPATCHYAAAVPPPPSGHAAAGAAVVPAAEMPSCTWDVAGGGGGGGGGGDSAPLLLYLPVQEPRSDVLRLHMNQLEGFKMGELLQPNLIRGVRQAWSSRRPLGLVTVPLAPLCAEPGVSVTAWLPLHPPGNDPAMGDPLPPAGKPEPSAAEMHRGVIAGRPQLEGSGEGRTALGATGSGSGGAAEDGFGAAGHQAVWAVPAGVAQPPIATAAAAAAAEPLLALPPQIQAPALPPWPDRARGGAVLVSLSYLSLDVLGERLATAVTKSLRTTGELPFVQGLLLIDVISARWLLGPDAYRPGEKPANATATMYDKVTAPATATAAECCDSGRRDDGGESSAFSDEDEDEDEDGDGDEEALSEIADAEPVRQRQQQQRQRQVEIEAAVNAAARIIAADTPLTFLSVGQDAGSMHISPAAARVLGSAAHMGDSASAGGLALRNRHGRIRCDPYVQIQVMRPVMAPPSASTAESAASAAQVITPSGGAAAAAAGGVLPYIQRGSPVPASADPSFNLHAEVDEVVPAADGCELRVQVWHRRWFQRPKPLGQAVLPLRYLLETHQGSTSKVPARGPVMTATAAAAAGISSADGAGCVRAGDMDGLPPISTGRMEGWMRLGGKGARGGEVQVRLQFLPYLLS